MKVKRKLLITMFFVLASCSQESYLKMTFHRDDYKHRFIAELDKAGVPYRVDGMNVIYPEKKHAEVKDALASVHADYPVFFETGSSALRDRFVGMLERERIPYDVSKTLDGKDVVEVENDYRQRASDLFAEARKESGIR